MRWWDASFRMSATASDCDSCWSNCRAKWARRRRGHARTGPTRRRPTASLATNGSANPIFSPVILPARARDFPLAVASPFWFFTTRRSCLIGSEDTASIGILKKIPAGHKGRAGLYTSCGILMHSSLVATREGLPLGLAAIKFWNRDKFHGANALKRRVNPTRVPIEKKESIRWLENLRQSTELLADPGRCVHIGDRESDIYELFCLAQQLGTHFLVRTCVDRLAGDGEHTVRDEMKQAPDSWTARRSRCGTSRASNYHCSARNSLPPHGGSPTHRQAKRLSGVGLDRYLVDPEIPVKAV